MLGRMLEMFMGCPNGCDDQIDLLEAENAALRARLDLADELMQRAAEYQRNSYVRPFYEDCECHLIEALAAYRASAGEVADA